MTSSPSPSGDHPSSARPSEDAPQTPVPIEGYCFRCKARKVIHQATETRMKNGRPVVTGSCVTCGTKMFKLLATR